MFTIPQESFALIDSNGAGKSSLLSAIYSIYTGKSWPGVKLAENMTVGQFYFGVLTEQPDWSFTAQTNASGRLSSRYQKPAFDLPVLYTYSPDDNYWLSLPRNYKLSKLDLLIGSINSEYLEIVSKLDKFVRAKQKILKDPSRADFELVVVITQSIHDLSAVLWSVRQPYLEYIENSMGEFASWIDSGLIEWQVEYEISDTGGIRRRYATGLIQNSLDRDVIKDLWERERMIGKVMYGAQRDEFQFVCRGVRAQNSLSRGENRLLTLFVKYLTQKKVIEQDSAKQIWWLLDDVYNELDSVRESILQTQVLSAAAFSIYSGTRLPDGEIPSFTVQDLITKI